MDTGQTESVLIFLLMRLLCCQDEVEKRSEEVLAAKRESGFKLVELTQELAEKTEELGIASKQEEFLHADLEKYR